MKIKTQLVLLLSLAFALFFTMSSVVAAPVGKAPEGIPAEEELEVDYDEEEEEEDEDDETPFGCEIIRYHYIESEKCQDGACYVPEVSCCGNEKIDGELLDSVSGLPISKAETCDGEPFCRASCNYCGDGIVQVDQGEACDLGELNGNPSSGCTAECRIPGCGNGIVEEENDEECDDENDINDDECSNACKLPVCRDGIVQDGEKCDDGNDNDNDFCSNTCARPVCGDGVRQGGEVCDGNSFGPKPSNITAARWAAKECIDCNLSFGPYCGDRRRNQPSEQCDLGAGNGNPNRTFKVAGKEYSCTANCRTKLEQKECVWIVEFAPLTYAHLTAGYKKRVNEIDRKVNVPGCFARIAETYCAGNRKINTGFALTYTHCNPDALSREISGQGLMAHINKVGRTNKNASNSILPTFYMNDKCKITKADGKDVCGYAGGSVSPVSLLLEENQNLNSEMTVVPFSLDLAKPGSYSLWKASGVSPLLVFDPKKTGQVSSAAQLFGNWSFGGKKTSDVILSSLDKTNNNIPWGNGFEALAALDLDADGKLQGEELAPISLWYDYNRDGHADAGEVRDLREDGFVTLFFRDVRTITNSADLEVPYGYERIVDGKLQTGRAVDWYGETFASKKSAIDALSAIYSQKQLALLEDLFIPENQNEDVEINQNLDQLSKIDLSQNISGLWMWNLKEDTDGRNPGVLILEQDDSGKVRGVSMVEMQLENNADSLFSAVKSFPITGVVVKTEAGLIAKIKGLDLESGSEAISELLLSKDGQRISAKSNQVFSTNSRAGVESVSVGYEWEAVRITEEDSTE